MTQKQFKPRAYEVKPDGTTIDQAIHPVKPLEEPCCADRRRAAGFGMGYGASRASR